VLIEWDFGTFRIAVLGGFDQSFRQHLDHVTGSDPSVTDYILGHAHTSYSGAKFAAGYMQ
jgi:hypothetical protein